VLVTLVHVALYCAAVLAGLLTSAVVWALWQYRKRPYKLKDLLDLSNDDIDPDWDRIRKTLGRPGGPPPGETTRSCEPADPPGKCPC
jgi:hypothetical protein